MRAQDFIKENETIMEVPLPSDWDKTVFTPQQSYKKRIDYAVARAQRLGSGSSRKAFIIDYDGRQTVLKIAFNKKGMAQNEAEAAILDDYYAQGLDILIPLIDYDEDHDQPVWIHTEMAKKTTPKQLCQLMKCPSLHVLIQHANLIVHGKNASTFQQMLRDTYKLSDDDIETFMEYSDKLTDLSNSFDVNLNDFTRAANWGLYNGNPVLLDIGFTHSVASDHYQQPRF